MFRKPQHQLIEWDAACSVQTVAERAIEARQQSLDRCQIRRDELAGQKRDIEAEIAELDLEIEALESAAKVYADRLGDAVELTLKELEE